MIIPPTVEAHGITYYSVDHLAAAMRTQPAYQEFAYSLPGNQHVDREAWDCAIDQSLKAALSFVGAFQIEIVEPRA